MQAAQLGALQEPSIKWDGHIPDKSRLVGGPLGNWLAQRPQMIDLNSEWERYLWERLPLFSRTTRSQTKLQILKKQTFTTEGREARIASALAALDAPQHTNLTLEQWKWVIEESEDSDEG